MIRAIWEKIFTELLRNRINTNPPKIANGTVKIIMNGWIKELKVAAITKYAVSNAKAKIINNSLLVSLISSDFPFQVIWFSGAKSVITSSKYFIASVKVYPSLIFADIVIAGCLLYLASSFAEPSSSKLTRFAKEISFPFVSERTNIFDTPSLFLLSDKYCWTIIGYSLPNLLKVVIFFPP